MAPPRPQHYIQACCHLTVYAFWGYYWRPVYDFAPLLVGQLFFAYAFDMLLSWSRRESYGLGFGPFPIIFSTNLFLWFMDDWFAFQFLLVAIGFAGKAFVRWERDGKRVHIFNPSAFTLAIFSVVLLATGTTHLTWGQEIATHAQPGALHLYRAVPGRARGHVLLLDHASDRDGGAHVVCRQPDLLRRSPACRTSSTPTFRRRCSLACTCS